MEFLEVKTISGIEQQLNELLVNCVESGASVGFLIPLSTSDAASYWQEVEVGLNAGSRKLFIAKENNKVLGVAQLSLCDKANGSHRGEIEKLMVHTEARGKGISKLLMQLIEETAKNLGLLLLVLDTRAGDIASTLYRKMGYTEAGQIPIFARSSSGELEATVYFYKQL